MAFSQGRTSIGLSYSYGAGFNFHKSNSRIWKPGDISVPAVFFHLDNGNDKLGFRAALGWRMDDIRYRMVENFYLKQHTSAAEMKLQCVLPVSEKSHIALGIAPRLIFHSSYSMEYINEITNTHYSTNVFVTEPKSELNRLNTALAFSWYYTFAKRWQVSFHIDQDMLSVHRKNIHVNSNDGNLQDNDKFSVNARLTTASAALCFLIR